MRQVSAFTLVLLALAGCGKPVGEEHGHAEESAHNEVQEEHGIELTPEAEKIAGIVTQPVSYEMVESSFKVPGTVSSTTAGRAVVTPPAAGRIISLLKKPGDRVAFGETVAILESPELAQSWAGIADAERQRDAAKGELKLSESEVKLAQSKHSAAKISLTRQQALVNAGAFSQAPVQHALNELNDAQSDLLGFQKEQASHAEQLRRLENLFKEGIVSKSDLEASRLELQQDQIKLDRAKARIENAKATYERESAISSRGLNNAKELQTAEAEVRASQLEIQRAKLKVQAAIATLRNAEKMIGSARATYRSTSGNGSARVGTVSLVAPIAGTVSHMDITRGQAVDRTQTVMEIENLDSVWVTANVPERDAFRVAKGNRVKITATAIPGVEFDGLVQVVGSKVDPKSRTLPVQCLVIGAAGRLKPDMFANVFLGSGGAKKLIMIDQASVLKEGGQTVVFMKDGEHYEKVAVELGEPMGNRVPVISGLNEGDLLVTKGAFVLASEAKKSELKGHDH